MEEHSGPSMKEILDERDRKYKSLMVLWAAAEFPKQHAHRMSCQDRWTQGVHHFARLVARGTEPEPDPKWAPLAFPPEHAKAGLTQESIAKEIADLCKQRARTAPPQPDACGRAHRQTTGGVGPTGKPRGTPPAVVL